MIKPQNMLFRDGQNRRGSILPLAGAMPWLLLQIASAQNPTETTLLFGMRTHSAVRSGISGTQSNPGNEAGVINRYGIAVVSPQSSPTDAAELVNFGSLIAYYGDTNADGIHAENPDHGGAEAIDAIWIPGALSNPPRWEDVFYSPGVHLGGAGGLAGTPIRATEMVRIRAWGPPEKLFTELDLEILLGTASGELANNNLNGFTKDLATGNMYLTFQQALSFANGTLTASPGDLLEISGNFYVPQGPAGAVSFPQPGGARLAILDHEFRGIAQRLNVPIVAGALQLRDVDFDPAGGVFPAQSGPVPNLLFTFDNTGTVAGAAAAAIFTTRNGGDFALLNGQLMNHPHSLGLRITAFNGQLCASVDSLAVVEQSLRRRPLTIDRFPNASFSSNPAGPGIVTPGPFEFSAAGISPAGPGALLLLGFGPAGIGTAAYRAPAPVPLIGSSLLQIASNDPLLSYMAFDPAAQGWFLANPLRGDQLGYGTFRIQIPIAMPVGFLLVAQAVDLADLTLSAANVVRF